MTEITARLSTALADRYRIERELGAGGMATVYLAHDLKHNRKVAIKVLRPELAAVIGAERFLKEIEVTANLQHPHILPLFDSGEADTLLYYVMPFIDGESLRDRLDRQKQLAVGDAVRIAREVADALQHAHERGVVHRDIKPENILLQNGRPMVADFGIALAVQQAGGSRLTETGLSLGTPHYMSPEQAMGERDLDARSDVYALAATLYEMLVGEPPFTGPNAQAIVAKVLASDPEPVTTVRGSVPAGVAEAVHVGLEKLPADRFATAAEFGQALVSGGERGAPQGAAAAGWRGWVTDPRTLALVGIAVAGTVIGGMSARSPAVRSPTRRAMLPVDNALDMRGTDLAVSANGSVMVVSGTFGVAGLAIRRMDELEPRPVPRSTEAAFPFLSPDGSRLGFHAPDGVVVQTVGGSDRQQFPETFGGGTFLDNDRIAVFDSTGLVLLALSSGEREVLVPRHGGVALQAPFAMEGGRRVIFTAGIGAGAQALVVDVETRNVDTLVQSALSAQQVDGWLYYALPSGALYAAPMGPDDASPTGPAVALGEIAMVSRVGTAVLATGRGVIIYGQRQLNRLVALDAEGRRTPLMNQPALYHSPRVSPDGRRVVFDKDVGGIGGRDVWILDLESGSGPTRVTSVGDAHDPVWTPDGRRVTYLSFLREEGQVFTVSADGGPGELVLALPAGVQTVNPGTWLPNGAGYIAGLVSDQHGADLAILAEGVDPDTIFGSPYDEHSPALSPDGRWLAYVSTETGSPQVYVRLATGDGGRTMVSESTGVEPVWHPDGAELFYVERDELRSRMAAARIAPANPPRVVGRRIVFDNLLHEPVGNHANWDIMPDGRLLIIEPERRGRLTLIFDWAPPERN